MATNGGEIKFKVGFDVNKAGLDNLEKTLSHLKSELSKTKMNLNTKEERDELEKVRATINNVQNALRNSFNSDLGVMNVAKLNSALKGLGIDKVQKDFSTMGAAGQIAFKNIATQALTTNMQLKQTHNLVDKMAETLGNTLKWNISSGAINKMTGVIQEAWGFTKSLDSSLNDIMIVTGKNADEMERFARNANKAAKELSAGTTDYTKASLIYYQQGLSDEETAARAETTVKVANVTGQNADTVSQNLTAVWNGYKVSAEEAELYIDKLSAVAASTAADLDGLSTGMSKVASAANIMGVDVDQLNATLATVISVTQQAPESVGTAFKTIYARMGDIEAGIDSETTLGAYTSQMKEIANVSVLDANGKLREMGEVVEEVGGKWNTLSREQQIALSQVMAGTRQYNNLLSLFDNWDMYTKTLEESANAAGTLQEQQDIYQQSVAATLQELRTAYEGLYNSLADTDSIKDIAEVLTFAIERVTDFTEALGGGKAVLSTLGAIATRVFSKQIAQGIATTIANFKIAQSNASQIAAQMETIELFGGRQNIVSGYLKKLTDMKKAVLELGDSVTNEQHEQANAIIKTTNEIQNQKIAYEESLKNAEDFLGMSKGSLTDKDFPDKDEAKDDASKKIEERKQQYKELFEYEKEIQEQRAELNKKIDNTVKNEGSKSYTKSLDEEQKARKKLNDTIKQSIEKSSEEIKSMNLSEDELKDYYVALEKYNNLLKEINKTKSKTKKAELKIEVKEAGEEVMQQVGEIAKNVERKTKEAENVVNKAANGASKNFEDELNKSDKSWEDFINNLQTVKKIQGFVQIIGGINQITSGLQSLWNITNILDNEDLSSGEKAIQIISALSMGLSMLISGFSSVTTLLPTLIGLEIADTAAKEGNTKASLKNALANSKLGKSLSSLKTKWLGMSTAAKLSVGTLGVATIAIIALTVAIGKNNEAMRKDAELRKNVAQSRLENVKKQQEEIQSTDELVSSYMDLYNIYKETGDASSEFLSTKEQIIDALGLEKAAIANLTGDYKSLTIEILKAKGAEAQREKELAEDAMRQSENFIAAEMFSRELTAGQVGETFVDYVTDGQLAGAIYGAAGFGHGNELLDNVKAMAENDRGYIQFDPGTSTGDEVGIADYFNEVGIKYEKAGDFGVRIYQDLYKTEGEIADLYGKLIEVNKQIIEDGKNDPKSEEYSALLSVINNEELKEYYDEYNKQKEIRAEALAKTELYNYDTIEKLVNIGNQKDYQEAKAAVEKIVYNDEEYGDLTEAEKDKKVEELVAEAIGRETAKNYEERIAFTNELKEQFRTSTSNYAVGYGAAFSDPSFLNGGPSSLAQVREHVENTISGLSSKEFSALTTVVDIDRLKSKEIFDSYVNYAKEYAKAQEIELKISTTEDLINSLKEGKELTDEQKQALKELEEEYPTLQSIQDKTSKDYIKNLLQVQQHLEEQRIATEEAATSTLISYALALEVNTDEYEETMKDITEQQYKVLVAVEADIQSDFDNLVNNMDDIGNIASKIGDDFIVAASDLEELNDVFPGILANMELTEDGSVKLNSTITKEAIEAAKNQIKADTASTVEKLNNQAKELETKRDAARTIAKQLREGYDGEKLTVGAKQALTENLAIFQSETNAELATQEQTDAKNVAQASADSAKDMVTNYSTAYEQMSRDAVEWAKIAQQALKASTDVNADLPTMPGDYEFGTKDGKKPEFATTVAINESEIPDFKQINEDFKNNKDGLTQDEAKRLADYFDNLADSYDEAINNTYGKVAEALARENEQLNKFNNIQKGKGSDGQKSKDNIDYLNKEIDLYREVNLEIAKQEKLLNKLEKEQDKLGGKELIDNLNKQLDAIEKQNLALERKIEIGKREAQALRDSLSKEGVSFGEDGYISNYQAMLNYKEDYLRRVTEKYNLLSEAEQKEYKHYVDEAQKDYDNFKEDMDRYTDLVSEELPDWAEEIKDNLDKKVENQIKKFNYEVELTLDLSEAKRQWDDFKRDILIDEDDALSMSKSYLDEIPMHEQNALMASEQALKVQKEIDIINAGGTSSIYGNNLQAATEDLEKWHNEAMNSVQSAKSAAEQSRQLWLSGIDDSINELNKTAEVYDTLASLYNHDMNMVTMLYGEDEYEKMENIYAQRQANDLEELNNIKEREKYYKRMMDAETDPEAKEKWEKAWLATVNNLTSKTEEAVKTVLDKHANAVKKVIEEINEKLLPKGTDLDFLGQEWDLIQESSNRYLDDIEAGFGIQDLKSAFDDAFDTTDTIAGQTKLNKVYEEQMNILREKDKLSQYDLDRAQAMLDITLKEIALEEARQNKSSMRLRRDAQGNYSYQYVEDEEATSNAEKELQDAKENLYKLDKEKYLEDVKYVYDKTKELEDKIIELYNDTTLSAEEREKKKALLIEQYGPLIEAATADVESGKERLAESTQLALETIGDEIIDDFIGKEGVGTLPELESGLATFVDNLSKEGGMKEVLETTFDKLDEVLDDTEQSIKDIEKAAGEDFDAIGTTKDDVDGLKSSVDGLKINLDKLIKSEEKETEVLKKLHTQADTRLKDLTKINGQIMTNITSTQNYIEAMKQAQIEGVKTAGQKPKASPSSTPGINPTSNVTPPDRTVPSGNDRNKDKRKKDDKDNKKGKVVPDDIPEVEMENYPDLSRDNKFDIGKSVRFFGNSISILSNGKISSATITRKNDTYYNKMGYIPAKILNYDASKKPNPYFIEIDKRFAKFNKGWVSEDTIQYKTGGLVSHTGLAWLDGTKSKPELVLNSSDTPKLLEAAKLLRNVDDLAKSLEDAVFTRMSNRLSKEYKVMSEMMKITAIEKTPPTPLEQNVHIDADFPNVSDSREIEMAFENLINVASQYAYQNR